MKKRVVTIIIGIEAVIIAAVIVFLFYISSDTVRANRQLELAQRYLLEEDYEQAIAAFEIVIEIDPKNAEAYLGLAEAYVSIEDLGNAVKILENAVEQTDSEEILDLLEERTEEMKQRERAAQRAAETAALAAASEAAANEVETTAEAQTQETEIPGEMEEQKEQLPIEDSLHLIFASGAGAWGTELELSKDGTFSGYYSDSNMGETGEGYPGGTVYFCSFSGKFDKIKQIDECTYSMTLSELTSEYTPGWEQIEEGVLYIASEPYGIEEGKEFLFYTPEVSINVLSEDFLSWCMALGDPDNEGIGTLSYYGLYNKKMG